MHITNETLDVLNITIIQDDLGGNATRVAIKPDSSYIAIAYFINHYLIPPVCTVGFIGNVLTVAILVQRQFRKNASDLGSSAHTGLIALAVSDMLYCLLFLPNFFWPERFKKETIIPFHPRQDFWFYQQLYIKALSSVCVTCSTLLTVNVALGRYVVVCHPIKARDILLPARVKSGLVISLVLGILLNLPRFFTRKGQSFANIYWIGASDFVNSEALRYLESIHAIIGLFLPIMLLLFCNMKLSQALYKSVVLRRQSTCGHVPPGRQQTHHRLTLTLVLVICIYFIGVTPLSLLNFATDIITRNPPTKNSVYYAHITNIRIASAVLKVTEAVAFSLNFLLYCAINVSFRRVFKEMLWRVLCIYPEKINPKSSSYYRSTRLASSHL